MEKEQIIEVFALLVAKEDPQDLSPKDVHGSYSKSTYKGTDRDDSD
ncbi:MAG: hypothetical protein M1320_00255 [Patescibacteria group bacterium]|nr:hypothetical protein [Patescibacteria group bacterium]